MPILRFRTRSGSALHFAITLTVLLISPLSLSSQTNSFSLFLDLDESVGDQAVPSLDVSPNRDISIQIFGTDIQNASHLSVRFEYDATDIVYEEFDAGDVMPNAQVATVPSPDFDGSGFVDSQDYSLLIKVFGYREGQEGYEAKYDLNGDGEIGLDDFFIFLRGYGTWVKRAPVFTSPSPVRLFVDENTPGGEPIGDPISATDADGDMLTYHLRGTDVDLFAIDVRTGQIQTREGITYDYEYRTTYSVIVEVSDGQGGSARLLVIIKINDVKEPPPSPPSNFWVRPDNESLTVHYSAVSDEQGRPPVRGYHAEICRGEKGPWGTRKTIYGRTNTSVYYRHIDPEGYHSRILVNGQLYQVRVRAYNSDGASAWSAPVSGIPVYVPPKETPKLAQFQDEDDRAQAVVDLSHIAGEGGRIIVTRAALPATIPQEEVEGIFLDIVEVAVSNAPDIPANAGFTLPTSSSFFDIELKARINNQDVDIGDALQSSVEICLPVPAEVSDPVIISYNEGQGAWRMLVRQDVDRNVVCGYTDRFSPFGVGLRVNRAPVAADRIESQTLWEDDEGVTVDVSGKFSDSDGDELTYGAVSSDEAVAKVNVSGSMVTITPVAEGKATIIVTARDAAGSNQTAEQTIAVTVRKAEEKLSFGGVTIPAQTYTVGRKIDAIQLPEATGGTGTIGYTLTPALPEGLTLDAETHTISGTLTVAIEATEYKWQAIDADEYTVELTFYITVESANHTPRFISNADFEVEENALVVGTVVAEDADTDDSITGYGIVDGADGSQFSIGVVSTGVLTFKIAPNYEDPTDLEVTDPANAAENNEYIVIVTATGGAGLRALTVRDTLKVTVTDVNEAPGKPSAPTVSTSTVNSLTVSWSAPTNTGPAISAYDVRYILTSASDENKGDDSKWTVVMDAWTSGSLAYTISSVPQNTSYDIQVRAENAEGTGAWSDSVVGTTAQNQAPVFASVSPISVAENSTVSVAIVSATDADSQDNITGYAIVTGGDGSQFSIGASTGVLTFKTAPNYEAPTDVEVTTPANAANNNEYIVFVEATSGTNARALTATQTITVTVTDVTESPGKPSAPTVSTSTMNSLTVSWSAPTNTGPEISAYDVRYILTSASDEDKADESNWTETADAWTNGSLECTIGSLNQNTGYDVQVRAKSDEGTGPWSDSVTGTTSANSAPVATGKIYWSDNGTDKIQRSNLDGSNVEDLVTRLTLRAPVGIALDISGGKMYWIDESTDKIQRTSIELEQGKTTRTVEDLVTTGLTAPSGIALDISGGKMYWVDRGTDKIQRSNLDGSNVEDLVTSGLTAPSGIALDISGGKMYWVDRGTDKIQRSNLDGSNVEDLITTGLTAPSGIALDISGGKMYWVDNGTDKIQRSNLDGSNVEDLITGVSDPRGIALDISGGKMYWVDNGADKIQRSNLDGSSVEDVITTGLTTPVGIALDVISGQILTMGKDGTVDVSGYFTDPDDDALMYGALSSDTGIATVSVVGSVVTIKPVSSGRATITVTASDDHLSVDQTFTVTVIETRKENNAPVFTSMSSFSMSENSTEVGTVTATDDADDAITGYAIVAGGDGSLFSIAPLTGVLSFKVAPDYESPADVEVSDPANAATNNEYIVIVSVTSGASDRELTAMQTITVTVTDVNELPGVPGAPTVADATLNSLKVQWSVPTNTGPAISAYDVRYILTSADETNDANWTVIADVWTSGTGGSLEYTVSSLTQNTSYDIQVRAESDEGTSGWSGSVTGTTDANNAPVATGKIYWSDNGTDKIQRSNLDGSNVEDLVTRSTLRAPVGIALDISGGKMYWVDESTDKIQRTSIELEQDKTTRTVEDLVTSGLTAPSGIALDISGGKMYWVDRGTDKIQRSNLDGSNVEDLVTTGLTAPSGIALDISGGKMYWVDRGTDKIQRSNLDGSNVEDLITTGLTAPSGIALDISGGKMYWVDNGTDKIQRTSIELGQGDTTRTVEDLITGVSDPRGIALDISGGKMYWVDNGADKIQRSNLDGSSVEDVITTGLTTPVSIALDF